MFMRKIGWIPGRWINIALFGIFLIIGLFFFSAFSNSVRAEEIWTGNRIMDEAFRRHELFPYIFEEQSMILMDDAGNRDIRKVRRFSRVEKDRTVKFLLVFDSPPEVRGVALLAIRQKSGHEESGIYLPAFGKELKSNTGNNRSSNFLGTDFSIEDMTAEVLSDHRYVRAADSKIEKTNYFVVEAFPKDREIEKSTGYSHRRHFIRQDNFFIVRTDYFDRRGRFFKRQTHHDLKKVDRDMWRANMVLMENYKERHKTLIKINRRVFSHDYVPPEMFTSDWLLENRHLMGVKKRLLQDASKLAGENNNEASDEDQKEGGQKEKIGNSSK